VVNVRLFDNNVGLFDLSPLNVQAELLVVSQFTLHAQTRKGRRPSFTEAMAPEQAEVLYKETLQLFQESGLVIATGIFKSHMDVSLTNDGPVTLMIDSADRTLK
jgi:D-tyrosyl-tRNA(Tyr) deacylase